MKRYKHWVAAVTALLLCLSMSGCARLDEMRARHAVWQEDGTILWNNAVYKPLPTIKDADINLSRLDDTPLHVTEADVPVLLSNEFYDYFECDKEGVFLRGYIEEKNDKYYGEYKMFCREDRYEEVAAEFANGFVSKGLCYDYFDTQLGAQQTVYLTVEQEYAISYILDTAEWYYEEDVIYMGYEVELHRCDAFDLYRAYEMRLVYNGDYRIIMYDKVYMVPANYEQTMRDILQPGYIAYVNQHKEWYE